MRHRAVVADLPLLTTDGTRTTLKDAATERVAVARSCGVLADPSARSSSSSWRGGARSSR